MKEIANERCPGYSPRARLRWKADTGTTILFFKSWYLVQRWINRGERGSRHPMMEMRLDGLLPDEAKRALEAEIHRAVNE